MSLLACKLFEERENRPQVEKDYIPFARAVFGNYTYDTAMNQNESLADEVEDALFELGESNPFGFLQSYYMEERYLHGKTNEEIKAEIVAHMDIFLKDLENISIRFLRHPEQGKYMHNIVKQYIPPHEKAGE